MSHSVRLANFCGYGTPILDHPPSHTLMTGTTGTYTNSTIEAVAFLNNGFCGPNGGNCTVVDLHLGNYNGTSGSGIIIDLVPTHVYTVPVSFTLYDGCDGAGASCLSSNCTNAMRDPLVTQGLVTCDSSTTSVLVTFCPLSAPTPVAPSSSGRSSATPLEPRSSASFPTNSGSTSPPAATFGSPSITAAASPTAWGRPMMNAAAVKPATRTAAIAGGVVGGLVLVGLLALAAFCLRLRRRRPDSQHADPYLIPPAVPFGASTGAGSGSSRPSLVGARTLSNGKARAIAPSADPFARVSAPASTSGVTGTSAAPPQEVHVPGTTRPELEHIVEQLASRFGWTTIGAPGRPVQQDEEMLPQYAEATRHV